MFAIATLVMRGDRYVPGAIALGRSLRQYSEARLVCMVTSDVTKVDELKGVYDEVITVDRITVDTPPMASKGMRDTYGAWIDDACTKWNILSLYRYKKVLFMDADMIAVSPIDSLFMLDVPAAVFDSHFSSKYTRDKRYAFPTTYGIDSPYGDMKHGDKVSRDIVDTVINDPSKAFMPNGGLVLVEPSRFAMNMLLSNIGQYVPLYKGAGGGIDEWVILLLYHNNGYTWTNIDISYNVAAYHIYDIVEAKIIHYITRYKPWEEDERNVRTTYSRHLPVYRRWHLAYGGNATVGERRLRAHLEDILIPILGDRVPAVLDKYMYLYTRALTTSNANPVSNYELLEAYGDRILAGQYVWVLLNTPGIITADQVTKISSFFQSKYALEKVCDHLRLLPYISTAMGEKADMDTKADVIESLIAAIAISWQRMYGMGNTACRTFISKVWLQLFTIDPANYVALYEGHKTRMKQLIEKMQLDRTRLHTVVQEGRGEIMVNVLYGTHLIGTGTVSTVGLYRDTAIRMAERLAYADALDNDSLELLHSTL
jgi:alpha-N-acetylglucosamine transferase/dsRNA-specific ribonuclease